ncbi:hypothetical protein UW163_10285 [Ralstonia solanacearum]|nr:hypothetical protein UW163_10285 [Ralstonia solanacearum]AMP73254.1 hypothetical protein RALBFv3_03375 [Ralstonia solanacearum]
MLFCWCSRADGMAKLSGILAELYQPLLLSMDWSDFLLMFQSMRLRFFGMILRSLSSADARIFMALYF